MAGQYMTWSTCRIVDVKAIQREPNRNDSADKAVMGVFPIEQTTGPTKRPEQGWIEITFPLPGNPATMIPEPPAPLNQPSLYKTSLTGVSVASHVWASQQPWNIWFAVRGSLLICRFCPSLFYSDSLISPYCSALYILSLPPPLWPLVSIVLVSFCLCWLIVSFIAFRHCGFRSIVACCHSFSGFFTFCFLSCSPLI